MAYSGQRLKGIDTDLIGSQDPQWTVVLEEEKEELEEQSRYSACKIPFTNKDANRLKY